MKYIKRFESSDDLHQREEEIIQQISDCVTYFNDEDIECEFSKNFEVVRKNMTKRSMCTFVLNFSLYSLEETIEKYPIIYNFFQMDLSNFIDELEIYEIEILGYNDKINSWKSGKVMSLGYLKGIWGYPGLQHIEIRVKLK